MRCKTCKETTKYAGKIARKRKICGSCMYAIRTLAKDCLNNPMVLKNHAR